MDTTNWIPKSQVARTLDCTIRTVERLVQRGRLQVAKRRGKPVYHPDDVEKLRLEMNPEATPAHVMPREEISTVRAMVNRAKKDMTVDTFELMRSAALVPGRLIDPTGQWTPRSEPALWVGIKEAAAITGLPQSYLIKRCQDSLKDPISSDSLLVKRFAIGWRIRRKDLEKI